MYTPPFSVKAWTSNKKMQKKIETLECGYSEKRNAFKRKKRKQINYILTEIEK